MTARPRRLPVLTVLIVLGALVLSVPSSSTAGEFTVRQCEGAGFQGFFGVYGQIGAVDRVDVVQGCGATGSGKIGIYQNRGGSTIPNGAGGEFVWNTPNGVEVFGTVFTSRLNDQNGMKASLLARGGPYTDARLDEGKSHDGQPRTTRWTDENHARERIIARLVCSRGGGCANVAGSYKAYLEVGDAEFRSRDVAAPTVTGSGFLWVWSNDWKWHRGNLGFRIDAADRGAGVASTYLRVNGLKVEPAQADCPGDRSAYASRFDPCPSSATSVGAARTAAAPFREGTNVVQFCSADYAASPDDANTACSSDRVLFIDNDAPAAPINLSPVGGTDWRAVNGFRVGWRNPEGQTSEITSAEFKVARISDDQVVDSGSTDLGEELLLPTIQLPEPGEYRVEVRLRDAAGNLGSPSSTTLRFDDARPGDVAPEAAPGWISADELPYRQTIQRAEPGGPSGVGGYAFVVSRSGPVAPCPSGTCLPLELSLKSGAEDRVATLQSLPEGTNWISAVAASGARLSSATVGSRMVRVDKTDPQTKLLGNPGVWVNHPLTLTAVATDSGSGMTAVPGDDGRPVTVIRAGSSASYESPGDRVSFTVADEGATRVEYWAEDLAGNANDGRDPGDGEAHAKPPVSTVRIDRRPPKVDFTRKRDPLDPELIEARAHDPDSGFESGRLSFRQVGQATGFTELETTSRGNRLLARLPSDDLSKGRYLIRAVTRDRAGNVGDTATDGSGISVTVPLKRETHLRVAFAGKKRARTSVTRFDQLVKLRGRLTRGDGRPGAGARLLIEQRFPVGSRRRKMITRTRTDGTGRFVAALRPGPSRTVRVTYPGSRINRRTRSRTLALRMRDRIRFRISPGVLRNRGRVRMSGSVRGKGALRPARGKLVAIEYFDPARSRWRPVEVLRTNRRGRFGYRYRFRTIDYLQRIIFRAVSLPETGWPFSPSTSRPKSVIVYPAGRVGR